MEEHTIITQEDLMRQAIHHLLHRCLQMYDLVSDMEEEYGHHSDVLVFAGDFAILRKVALCLLHDIYLLNAELLGTRD